MPRRRARAARAPASADRPSSGRAPRAAARRPRSSASAKPSSAISSVADRRALGFAAEQHCADAAEHARTVGEPADGVERRRHVHAALGVDAAVGGADAVEAAERGGDAHRAAGVGAEREVAGAGGGRGGRAARRAARECGRARAGWPACRNAR